VPLKTRIARTAAGTLILLVALVSVGLTSPADGPFSIGIRAIFLGVDVDVKIGPAHLRYNWSAIPQPAATTKTTDCLF